MALGATLYTRPRTEMDITISPTLRRRHTLFHLVSISFMDI